MSAVTADAQLLRAIIMYSLHPVREMRAHCIVAVYRAPRCKCHVNWRESCVEWRLWCNLCQSRGTPCDGSRFMHSFSPRRSVDRKHLRTSTVSSQSCKAADRAEPRMARLKRMASQDHSDGLAPEQPMSVAAQPWRGHGQLSGASQSPCRLAS